MHGVGTFVHPSTSERRELATVPVGLCTARPVSVAVHDHEVCTADSSKKERSIHKNKQLPTLTHQHHSAADVLRHRTTTR